jgi:serpin B
MARANNAFAVDLYGQVRDQPGNLFLSPYSVSTALAMTAAGARGETAAQMRKVLHLSLADDRLHPALAALSRALRGAGKDPGYELHVANALWGQKGFAFRDAFLELNQDSYGAGLEQVDFGKGEEARKTINGWVKKQTRDKVPELLQGELTADTRLVLTNAIYFKGAWVKRFDKAQTREADFRLAGGKAVKAPMMRLVDRFRYLNAPDFQALELPYQGGRLAMVLFLPHEVNGLAAWEKGLTAEKLSDWIGRFYRDEVGVELPRFTARSRFGLSGALSKLGMPLAFGAGADFSGLTTAEHFQINQVAHEAFADVNEEGTEAAAATAVEIAKGDGPQPRFFHADHPFFFVIRDTTTGTILCLGRVTDPLK